MGTLPRFVRTVTILSLCLLGAGGMGCDDNPSGNPPADTTYMYAADTQIVRIILDTNGLTDVPVDSVAASSDGRVTSLKVDNLGLRVVPAAIGRLDALEALYLHDNLLVALPDSITGLLQLSTLTVNRNRLCDPSPAVRAWLDEYVTLPGWEQNQECEDYATDSALVRAILDANGLIDVAVGDVCDTTSRGRIGELLLAHRGLRVLPDDIGGLAGLWLFDVHDNQLSDLPDTLMALPGLATVDLEYNRLCSLSTAMAAWADSLSPGWRSFQNCSTSVRQTSLFASDSVDTVVEGDGRWLVVRTESDSVVIDSITVALDADMPPVRITMRPIGVPAYTGTADSTCVIRSHGVSYGDQDGSEIIRVAPHTTAYLIGIDIQICVECSTQVDIPTIRDGDSLRGDLRFAYRRLYDDTTVAATATMTVVGTMDAQTIGERTPVRQWFMEIYSKDPPHETIDFSAMPDTCESYLDLRNDDPFDLAFGPDSLGAAMGIRLLGVIDTSGHRLTCSRVDSVAALVSTERFAFVQGGHSSTAPFVDGGIYWLRTGGAGWVLLVNTYNLRSAYDRHQFFWALYE
ncbi:MAG: hypothetical protein GF331_07800 [Chitinivibrionales bacterium]|nr:hypothetical protein [Chitinivibrionales bacterium]